MKVVGLRAIFAAVMMSLLVCAGSAQQPEVKPRKIPQLTTDDIAPRAAAGDSVDESLMLLPPSDLVIVIDAGRVFEAMMPQLKTVGMDEIAQMMKALDEFTSKTGIDPRAIKTAVIGVKMPDAEAKSGSGAVIIQGLTIDPQKLAAAAKAQQSEFKTLTHQGKTFYVASPLKSSTPSDKTTLAGVGEVAFALLDQSRVVAGDVASVKRVLETQTGASQSGSNALLGETLRETKSSGWIRFAANLPASFSQEVQKSGEAFQPFASVKVLSGSIAFDTAEGAAAAIDFKLHTSATSEASRLETHLKGLILTGKTFLNETKDPQSQMAAQLLGQVQIGAQANDVSVSLSLSKEWMGLFAAKWKAPASKSQ